MIALIRTPRFLNRKQAGDTIVEVVIAIAVIATVLAGAFAVTSASQRGVRNSEEHSEALQLLQGQVELLRSAAAQTGFFSAISSLSTPFCLTSSPLSFELATNDLCTQDTLYNLAISSPSVTPAVGTTTLFNLTATWNALEGGQNQVQLSYKVEVL
ncbi:MAG: type IV pilus modification PilV family protein [Candidatus Saccharimonadales bacterium]